MPPRPTPSRKLFSPPDWVIYFVLIGLYLWLSGNAKPDSVIPDMPMAPKLGGILPSESPRDEAVLIDSTPPHSGSGTAFAIDDAGTWLTARHVVEGCDSVYIEFSNWRFLPVQVQSIDGADIAVLRSDWTRKPLPSDLKTPRQIGEIGYFFGFPQGAPGEVIGSLLARNRMITRRRYTDEEPILAWTELGRSKGLIGSVGGMSGAPVLDKDGEIIGVVTAESPRRGRIYSVAPRHLRGLISEQTNTAEPVELNRYGQSADQLRRDRRIVKVTCRVD